MTTEELQEWHAVRAGWVCKCRAHYGKDMYHEERWDHPQGTWQTELMPGEHPFPATIDGAASAMPPGWEYWKIIDDTATGFTTWYWAGHPVYQTVKQLATGDEVHDRYALAKYAWEAMGPTK